MVNNGRSVKLKLEVELNAPSKAMVNDVPIMIKNGP